MRRSLTVVAGCLLAGVLPLSSACANSTPRPTPPTALTTAPVDLEHNSADVAFVQALIPHHREGIALATEVARPAEAHTLAEAIIVTQQDEVVRMATWLKAWHATSPPNSPGPTGLAKATSPSESTKPSESIEPSGEDALRALIAHQREAVALAQNEQAQGANPTALAFAKQIIESRTAEADQLSTYLS
jgi:uncharacterized protein (DUF305 family)